MKPLVSITTPTFNAVNTIERCILSVKNQTYTNIEHIIIDGGSTDGTIDIIKKYSNIYNLRWVSERDKGIYDAFNKGLRMAKGDIYAWLDGDNYYCNDIVEKIISTMKKSPEIEIVYGKINIVDGENNSKIYKPKSPLNLKNALFYTTGAIPAQPGVFFKKEIFKKTGGFDIDYHIASDFDFWLKALENKPNIYFLDEIFGSYKLEDNGASQSPKGIYQGYKEMCVIGKKYKQTISAKIYMFLKYSKCFTNTMIKIYLKK